MNKELTVNTNVSVTVGALGIRNQTRSMGYSRATVANTQLVNGRAVNVGEALSGRVSGLTINNENSEVQDNNPRIVLRGTEIGDR